MLFTQITTPSNLPQNAAGNARMQVCRIRNRECAVECNAARFGAQRGCAKRFQFVGQYRLEAARADRKKRGGHERASSLMKNVASSPDAVLRSARVHKVR